MRFDLSHGRLGDVLLAAPAMRAGDEVSAAPEHRVPGLPVEWLDPGSGGLSASVEPGRHMTDAWLLATGREPVWHALMASVRRGLTVIVPHVADPGRQWDGWDRLRSYVPDAVIVGPGLPRLDWMRLLSRADTVICPCTGTAHMADALGARVVGLYADRHRDFLPYWNRSACVVRDDMPMITLQDVLGALDGERA